MFQQANVTCHALMIRLHAVIALLSSGKDSPRFNKRVEYAIALFEQAAVFGGSVVLSNETTYCMI